jgi:surfactin synthase thioesterase subunit
MRLLAFHHAGGGTETFFGWRRRLGDDIEVVPVRLPSATVGTAGGRWNMGTLVAELNRELRPTRWAPHVFYGHSMGALVAYHLARLRWALDEPLPDGLLLGACAAPHIPRRLASTWSDETLARRMLDIGGLPGRLAHSTAWRAAAVCRVREHLGICETAADPVGADPLPCPIHVFAGQADPLVTLEHAAAWAQYTSAGCDVHPVPGGHFYFRDSKDVFFALLRSVVIDIAAKNAGVGPIR